MTADLNGVYGMLRKAYGKQGWWPIVNPESGRSEYGIGAPRNDDDIFEIAVGAILTQNVAWVNVEKAITSLKRSRLLAPERLHRAGNDKIAGCITSAGYYNQKAKKIKNFTGWFRGYGFSFADIVKIKTPLLRRELLGINGVGPETADSILLYGLRRKIFVIDAYTKRIYFRLGLIGRDDSYEKIQELFHCGFRGDTGKYNEYHALIVVHGKDVCKNKPLCHSCCLRSMCPSYEVLKP